MKILITGVGGPTPRSFAISLKKYSSLSVELFGTDSNPFSIGLYQHELFKKCFVVPKASQQEYWQVVNRIIEEHGIEMAVILPEMEVLAWAARNSQQGLPCKALLPPIELAKVLVDKAKMSTMLAPIGLCPKSISFDRDMKDFSPLFQQLGDSFWVRSSVGTSGLGSLHIHNIESLSHWVSINSNVSHYLASEYLPGRNLACKLLYFNGRLIRSACAERVSYIMAKVAPSGITGNTSFGRLINESSVVELAKKAMTHLCAQVDATPHGFFTIDFKEDQEGRPLVTEINVRHVAFTQCFAAAGANFAEDTVRLLSSDLLFDSSYREYTFPEGLIFLRDVDCNPVLMLERNILPKQGFISHE